MDRVGGILPAAGPVELGDDDAAAGGEAGEKADQEVDQLAGRAADRRQRLLADEVADDNRVDGVVKLLEEGPEQDREEEF